jgi:hypothetical protein
VGHGISCEYDALAGNAVNIRNNIIYIRHTAAASNIAGIAIDPDATDITVDYNVVFAITGATVTGLYKLGLTAYATLGEWQTAIAGKAWTGKSVHDLNTDPLFANAAGGDFRLQAGSPCINAGTNVSLTQDFAGRSVPIRSGVDIGAWEYWAHEFVGISGLSHSHGITLIT